MRPDLSYSNVGCRVRRMMPPAVANNALNCCFATKLAINAKENIPIRKVIYDVLGSDEIHRTSPTCTQGWVFTENRYKESGRMGIAAGHAAGIAMFDFTD